jgi:hypothetical protein
MVTGLYKWLEQRIGPIVDYLPIIHPCGYPQGFFIDYKNHLGFGHNMLFMSHPNHVFYLKLKNDFMVWLEELVDGINNNLFEKSKHGAI